VCHASEGENATTCPRKRGARPGTIVDSDVPDAGRRSDPRRVVGALSCFPPKIAITKRVRALCVRAARSVWLDEISVRAADVYWREKKRKRKKKWIASRDTALAGSGGVPRFIRTYIAS